MMIRPVKNGCKGFTLLESSAVLAAVMLLFGFVVPSLKVGLDHYRLSASAQDIANQIQSARYTALKNNMVCSFILMPSSNQYGLDANADGSTTGGQEVVLGLGSGITFANLTSPPISGATGISTGSKSGVSFTPRGSLTGVNPSTGLPDFATTFPTNGVVIYLAGSVNEFAAVTISSAGRTRTWRSPDGVTWQ